MNNNQTMISQIYSSWKNPDFQNLLKLYKNALDAKLIFRNR